MFAASLCLYFVSAVAVLSDYFMPLYNTDDFMSWMYMLQKKFKLHCNCRTNFMLNINDYKVF